MEIARRATFSNESRNELTRPLFLFPLPFFSSLPRSSAKITDLNSSSRGKFSKHEQEITSKRFYTRGNSIERNDGSTSYRIYPEISRIHVPAKGIVISLRRSWLEPEERESRVKKRGRGRGSEQFRLTKTGKTGFLFPLFPSSYEVCQYIDDQLLPPFDHYQYAVLHSRPVYFATDRSLSRRGTDSPRREESAKIL